MFAWLFCPFARPCASASRRPCLTSNKTEPLRTDDIVELSTRAIHATMLTIIRHRVVPGSRSPIVGFESYACSNKSRRDERFRGISVCRLWTTLDMVIVDYQGKPTANVDLRNVGSGCSSRLGQLPDSGHFPPQLPHRQSWLRYRRHLIRTGSTL